MQIQTTAFQISTLPSFYTANLALEGLLDLFFINETKIQKLEK